MQILLKKKQKLPSTQSHGSAVCLVRSSRARVARWTTLWSCCDSRPATFVWSPSFHPAAFRHLPMRPPRRQLDLGNLHPWLSLGPLPLTFFNLRLFSGLPIRLVRAAPLSFSPFTLLGPLRPLRSLGLAFPVTFVPGRPFVPSFPSRLAPRLGGTEESLAPFSRPFVFRVLPQRDDRLLYQDIASSLDQPTRGGLSRDCLGEFMPSHGQLCPLFFDDVINIGKVSEKGMHIIVHLDA